MVGAIWCDEPRKVIDDLLGSFSSLKIFKMSKDQRQPDVIFIAFQRDGHFKKYSGKTLHGSSKKKKLDITKQYATIPH